MEELDYETTANPPSGAYIVVSDDPEYRSWIGAVRLGNC
jgi:hypothetical protein